VSDLTRRFSSGASADRTRFDVVGIGNALVDVIAPAEDRFLERHGLVKGAMTLIETERAVELYAALQTAVEMSGGSAANTDSVSPVSVAAPPTSARSTATTSATCSATTCAPSACRSTVRPVTTARRRVAA
jgi:hypothetical protein